MAGAESSSRWRSYREVDAASDPGRLSGQLDQIASVPAVAAEKARSLGLLQLVAGAGVLDVGCGNGPELERLASIVGSDGRVVGLDQSSALIADARTRGPGELEVVELVAGDAHALPFADEQFEACRADRTLQHLGQPDRAVAELARVTRSGGRVVVTESRWGLVAPGLDRELTRRVFRFMAADSERNPELADRLPAMLEMAGLADVQTSRHDYTLDDYEPLARFTDLRWSLDQAVVEGAITRRQASDWSEHLRGLMTRGDAFGVVLFVHVSATKP